MGKYPSLGTLLNRAFRNTLNANFDAVDTDIQLAKTEALAKVAEQKTRVDNLIVGTPQPSEVVDARGGFPVLNDRLSNVTTNLADKTSQADTLQKWDTSSISKFTQYKYDLIYGREYLFALHNKIASSKQFLSVFSGDSTTFGFNLVDPSDWSLDNAFKNMCLQNGLLGVSAINKGHSSMCTEHWNRTYVAEDIALNPDLYVLRWGINDPAYDKSLNLLSDDGLNFNIRRNVDDFYKSLDEGLAKFRASKSYHDTTIILMSPNSTSHDASFRNENWHESINNSIRYLARKHQCVFIDTYRLWQDSRNASYWMDDVYGNGSHIHPLDIMNLWITDTIFNTCFSKLFLQTYGDFGKWNNLTLFNGWTNVPNYVPLRYKYIDKNTIELNGFIQGGNTTALTKIADLPKSVSFTDVADVATEIGNGKLYITGSSIEVGNLTGLSATNYVSFNATIIHLD